MGEWNLSNVYRRFVLGEGIEKKSADLAKEVEEQTNKMKEAAAQKALEAPKEEEAPEPTAEQVANLKVKLNPAWQYKCNGFQRAEVAFLKLDAQSISSCEHPLC